MASTMNEILRKVGEVLKDPAKRCRGDLAQDANGNTIAPESPEACRFCLEGALYHVLGGQVDEYTNEFSALAEFMGGYTAFWRKWDNASDIEQDAIVDNLLNS